MQGPVAEIGRAIQARGPRLRPTSMQPGGPRHEPGVGAARRIRGKLRAARNRAAAGASHRRRPP